ncbi:hypothetical protein GCM10022222_49150 [Amycolatopsis ultiminotia]|uniref:DDE superfamily endonuclease n=1 Tax=Amycolatopsis ultiminotia TaxID=543629 RepID=A0ABP6X0T5_9PSEU
MFAALDLATGRCFYRVRDRKRWLLFLDFCKQLRRRFPTGKLYLICDNWRSHGKAEVTTWCAANDIELVYTHPHLLAELDRVRVHHGPLLHPRRQQLPQPHHPSDSDCRLPPPAHPRRTQ